MKIINRQYRSNGQKNNLDPETILSLVERNPLERNTHKFIVLGRTGPTGKTWLTNKLRELGCDVVEISEDIYRFVDYKDFDNHYLAYLDKRLTIIILNHPI